MAALIDRVIGNDYTLGSQQVQEGLPTSPLHAVSPSNAQIAAQAHASRQGQSPMSAAQLERDVFGPSAEERARVLAIQAPLAMTNDANNETGSATATKKATSIHRDAFVEAIVGAKISANFLSQDPRTQGRGLGKADLDGDGVVTTKPEAEKLFTLLSTKGQKLAVCDRQRQATPQFPAVQALATFSTKLHRMLEDKFSDVSLEDGIVFIGMTPNATKETQGLRNNAPLYDISDGKESRNEVWDDSGKSNNLVTKNDIASFVDSLDVPKTTKTAIVNIIVKNHPSGWRELCALARVWARAENGKAIPKRLVLSGHSNGHNELWGEGDNNSISFTLLKELAETLPKAAAAIEDVHISACYCGSFQTILKFRNMFPNLQSIMAYHDSAPTKGAPRHIKIWERGTRGDDANKLLSSKSKFGKKAAFWTPETDYVGPKVALPEVIAVVDSFWKDNYTAYFAGTRVDSPARPGPLDSFYRNLQQALGHKDWTEEQNPVGLNLRKLQQQTLRLRYFSSVVKNFQHIHQETITKGYADIGRRAPDFSTMSRQQCLQEIDAYIVATEGSALESTKELTGLLYDGLLHLVPEIILDHWTTTD